MDRLGPTLIAAAAAVLALIGMYYGWRRRGRRDSDLVPGRVVPASHTSPIAEVHGFYVATTVHDNPFERIALAGLRFRSRAEISVAPDGVALYIPGQDPIFIPASGIARVAQATWAIDRVVEKNGLILLAWELDSSNTPTTKTTVDSYLRVVDDADRGNLLHAIESIAPTASTARAASESEV